MYALMYSKPCIHGTVRSVISLRLLSYCEDMKLWQQLASTLMLLRVPAKLYLILWVFLGQVYWTLTSLMIGLGALSSVGSSGVRISVEVEAVTALAGSSRQTLSTLNAGEDDET